MRCVSLSILLCVALPFASHGAEEGDLIDAVVATVDKDVILYSDLMSQVGVAIEELRRTSATREDFLRESNELVQDALDNSIERLLMAREARKYPQLAVSDKELDEQIQRIREDKGSTIEDFVKEVAGGSMAEYREWVRTQIIALRMTMMKTRSFDSEVTVTSQEVADYYEAHSDEYQKQERVYVRQILLRVEGDDAERERARAKLELIRDEILQGADFEAMAKMHSQAFGAELGGAIGWQRRDDLIEPLSTAAFDLPAGGVSEVIDTQFGVNLLKVDEREEAGAVSLADVSLEIEEILRQQGADEKYQTWLADLRKRSRVRVFLPQ